MNNFTFYSPTLFTFGDGEEKNTGALVRRFGGSRVLLVTGGGSVRRNGAYDAVTASLEAAGIPFTELSDVQANPRSGKVYEGIDLVRRTGADFLLALGGGSVIDTAKAIGFGALYKGDFWDFFTGAAKIEKTLPVGVVLTISAAGSEGSDSCVITQERGNLKWGCPKTDVIRPKFAVLNPRFTCSLPAYQTASGAVDMMAHILERYFTNTPDVALTDRLCEALLKTVLDAAPKAIADPNDYAARADLMWAGMLAHNNSCGVGRDQDWASHQIEHELSAFYDCAHGAGLAVIMPAVNHSYYANELQGERFWDYVSQELPQMMHSMFRLSQAPGTELVAGLSMGGYGAMKLALTYPERFAAAASFSGAVDAEALLRKREPRPTMRRAFGTAKAFHGSENDLFHLMEENAQAPHKPRLYVACGTEDFLYDQNVLSFQWLVKVFDDLYNTA